MLAKIEFSTTATNSYNKICRKIIVSSDANQKAEVLNFFNKPETINNMTSAELENYIGYFQRALSWLKKNFFQPIFTRANYTTFASVKTNLKANNGISPLKELLKITIYLPFRASRTAIGTGLAILPALFCHGPFFGNFGTACRKYLQREYSD